MYVHNKLHVLLSTVLHVSALITPSSGRNSSYAQNYCYIVWLQVLSSIICRFTAFNCNYFKKKHIWFNFKLRSATPNFKIKRKIILLEGRTCYINIHRVEFNTSIITLKPIASVSKMCTFQINLIKLYLHKRREHFNRNTFLCAAG